MKFVAHVGSVTLAMGVTESVLAGPGGQLRLRLDGADADASISGVDELAGNVNSVHGDDPAVWKTKVPDR